MNIIKRSLNYLHCRFDPDADEVRVMDARNIVVREGKRILKLGSKIGNFVSEDPYGVPDTLLRRQLLPVVSALVILILGLLLLT